TLITLFELKIYKSNIKSLKSYIGYYKFIKSNKNIKFKKDEKISIINSKNKIVKTSSNSFLVSIAIWIFILYLNISLLVNILLIFIFSILKYIKIKK
ncbi:hypothetical protein NG768_07445, partial [Aliarcobacter cryaerophilus]